MARMLAAYRNGRFTKDEIRTVRPLIKHLSKPMLIAALEDVQAICPPRITRQEMAAHASAVLVVWNALRDGRRCTA
jgi:hypothetical protein